MNKDNSLSLNKSFIIKDDKNIIGKTKQIKIDPKSELTIDFIMIIGKYYENNKDFINVMKLTKKYQELVSMYKFNPISDIRLFENIQTQHFYNEDDIENKKDGLYQYIYWYSIHYKQIINDINNKIYNNIYKKVLLDNNITNEEVILIKNHFPNINFDFNNDTIEIRKFYNTDYINVINVNYLKSIEEEDENDENNKFKQVSINIKDNITEIGSCTYADCWELKNITLPSTLKEIGQQSFNCSGIKSIIIPDSVTEIGLYSFYNCSNLTYIKLSNSLKRIDSAFHSCNITSITIPNGVTYIDSRCFKKCSNLKEVNLPDTLLEIGEEAFKGTAIEYIIIPNSVLRIHNECFKDCINLSYIELSNSLYYIGDKCFSNTNITRIDLPFSLNYIGDYCFKKCNKLKFIFNSNYRLVINNINDFNILTKTNNLILDQLIYQGKLFIYYREIN